MAFPYKRPFTTYLGTQIEVYNFLSQILESSLWYYCRHTASMESAVAATPTSTHHEKGTTTKLEGKFTAMVVCWLLGIGCSFSWNSMLTIEDYYVTLFPKYHPLRILTLVYQPFALIALAILAYHEANMNTRKRNLFGYTLFFIGTLVVLLLDLATSGKGGIGSFIVLCAVSGAFGVADAYVQGGMVGDLSFMLPEFIQIPFCSNWFFKRLPVSITSCNKDRLTGMLKFGFSSSGDDEGAMSMADSGNSKLSPFVRIGSSRGYPSLSLCFHHGCLDRPSPVQLAPNVKVLKEKLEYVLEAYSFTGRE
ncbi:hypothetical protein L1887_35009 [Cichorium endivia]|nr:hypothetical protein L1887_35009 [Cichorium endivia]